MARKSGNKIAAIPFLDRVYEKLDIGWRGLPQRPTGRGEQNELVAE
jgi:hypothetical protein